MEDQEPHGNREQRIAFADILLEKAEVFEKHQRLGHLRRLDGNQIAGDLRELAQTIRQDQMDR